MYPHSTTARVDPQHLDQVYRRPRVRLCAVCGMRKHKHYMQTFTENATKREEWMKLLYDNDAVLIEHQKQKLESYGRK
ncbi:hypothetical protein Y032_0086g1961 [Ancylostoma ceylanicum]|uniref:Uncharacterized protein n=1 Tax=Ancylostoma ceylanicum TaxID=53326 RepID=A0A016TQ10_9BILA|nr:hypothetical protein Y032_0086g1961 [Ancylostoma ceylanicum]